MASSVCCSLSSLSLFSVSYLFNVVINVHVNMRLDLCHMSVESSCTLFLMKASLIRKRNILDIVKT